MTNCRRNKTKRRDHPSLCVKAHKEGCLCAKDKKKPVWNLGKILRIDQRANPMPRWYVGRLRKRLALEKRSAAKE